MSFLASMAALPFSLSTGASFSVAGALHQVERDAKGWGGAIIIAIGFVLFAVGIYYVAKALTSQGQGAGGYWLKALVCILIGAYIAINAGKLIGLFSHSSTTSHLLTSR